MFLGSTIYLTVIKQRNLIKTELPWKAANPKLPTNLNAARSRLQSLLKKLEEQPAFLEVYHQIIEDQVEQGIVEVAPLETEGRHKLYIPHKPVVREQAETTKVRVVYDASAKVKKYTPPWNDCSEIGPLHFNGSC